MKERKTKKKRKDTRGTRENRDRVLMVTKMRVGWVGGGEELLCCRTNRIKDKKRKKKKRKGQKKKKKKGSVDSSQSRTIERVNLTPLSIPLAYDAKREFKREKSRTRF